MMKKFILLLVLPLFVALQMNAQTTTAPVAPANPNGPVASWDKKVNDFGEIAFNVPKTAEFTLTNTGKAALVIQSAQASCGCTGLKYAPEPILPGKSTIVSAIYNAASQGVFVKTITVTTNADPAPVVLQIKGTVLPQPAPSQTTAPAPK